jgi:hypothetical protein
MRPRSIVWSTMRVSSGAAAGQTAGGGLKNHSIGHSSGISSVASL